MIHTTIGLYPNGDYKVNGVLEEHLEGHIEYNRTFRPGRALFVDGVCVYPAKGLGLLQEEIDKFEKRIKENPSEFLQTKCTQPYV